MSCNENLRARKRRNEFPFPDPSEPSIARVLALHFLQGGGRKRSERVQRRIVDEALTCYRSGSSPSLSPLLSSFFYPLCSSRVPSLWCAFLGGTIDVSIPWGKRAPRVVQSGLRRRVCVVQKWCGVVDWREEGGESFFSFGLPFPSDRSIDAFLTVSAHVT